MGVHSGLPYAAAGDMMSAFTAMRQGRASSRRGGTSTAVPTIVFHGDRDSTVSPTNGEQVLTDCAAAAGLLSSAATTEQSAAPGGRSYTRRTIRDSTGEVIIEHWLIHGAGHAWAGGDPRGTYTDPRGPDASREMLRFFEAHRKNQLH